MQSVHFTELGRAARCSGFSPVGNRLNGIYSQELTSDEAGVRRDGWGAEPGSHLTHSSKCESGRCNPPRWILSPSVSLGYLNLGIVFCI